MPDVTTIQLCDRQSPAPNIPAIFVRQLFRFSCLLRGSDLESLLFITVPVPRAFDKLRFRFRLRNKTGVLVLSGRKMFLFVFPPKYQNSCLLCNYFLFFSSLHLLSFRVQIFSRRVGQYSTGRYYFRHFQCYLHFGDNLCF